MKGLSIYINFPFCRQKCHFCDWVQRVPKKDLFLKAEDSLRKNYLDALCKEIKVKGEQLTQAGYIPKVIYWGGGTATTMTQEEADKIVAALRSVFDLSQVTEWTIEGSPDTVSLDQLIYYKEQGFDRFSTGIQSFDDTRLKQLGRRHNREESLEVVQIAKKAGFEKISIDLMCGFPGETFDEVARNIEVVKDLDIKQLSLYTFRPTDGTMVRRQIDKYGKEFNPTKQVQMYQHGSELLKSYGFTEYGVGYFGEVAENVVGMFSMLYDVAGFGSGASSILDGHYKSHASGLLHQYTENPLQYDIDNPIVDSIPSVFTMLRSGLSIYAGIKLKDWSERVKLTLQDCMKVPKVQELVEMFEKIGNLVINDERVYLPEDRASIVLIGLVNSSIKSKSAE